MFKSTADFHRSHVTGNEFSLHIPDEIESINTRIPVQLIKSEAYVYKKHAVVSQYIVTLMDTLIRIWWCTTRNSLDKPYEFDSAV